MAELYVDLRERLLDARLAGDDGAERGALDALGQLEEMFPREVLATRAALLGLLP